MDAVKSPSSAPVQATPSAKKVQPVQNQPEKRPEPSPQEMAAKKAAYEPKPTTNTRGEKLGQRLNEVA